MAITKFPESYDAYSLPTDLKIPEWVLKYEAPIQAVSMYEQAQDKDRQRQAQDLQSLLGTINLQKAMDAMDTGAKRKQTVKGLSDYLASNPKASSSDLARKGIELAGMFGDYEAGFDFSKQFSTGTDREDRAKFAMEKLEESKRQFEDRLKIQKDILDWRKDVADARAAKSPEWQQVTAFNTTTGKLQFVNKNDRKTQQGFDNGTLVPYDDKDSFVSRILDSSPSNQVPVNHGNENRRSKSLVDDLLGFLGLGRETDAASIPKNSTGGKVVRLINKNGKIVEIPEKELKTIGKGS